VIDLSLVFVTGLLASLHCIGMCGPIVLAYSVAGDAPPGGRVMKRTIGLHVAYNGGRIASYAALGAVAGLAGMALSSVQTVGEYVSIVGGAVMIAAGILLLGVVPLPALLTRGWVARGALRLHALLLRSPTFKSKLALGLLTPLLPCGVLYAMAVKAATTQAVGRGALVMALFAVGMTPALAALGSLSSLFSATLRRGAEWLAAGTVILLGTMLLLRGLGVPYLSWLPLGGPGCSCCGH